MRNYDEQYQAVFLAAIQGQSARIADPDVIVKLAHKTALKAAEQLTRNALAETEKQVEATAAA